jgi:hypothetical protein
MSENPENMMEGREMAMKSTKPKILAQSPHYGIPKPKIETTGDPTEWSKCPDASESPLFGKRAWDSLGR